jgi:NAD(P)H-dependent FMN reductase
VAGFDAFVLVSPEYNHSTSAALKNALDHRRRPEHTHRARAVRMRIGPADGHVRNTWRDRPHAAVAF